MSNGWGWGWLQSSISIGPAPETFCYEVDMVDSAGDGWGNNALDFYGDGVLQDSATLVSGSNDTVNVCLTAGEVDIVWSLGSFANEVGFILFDENGSLLRSASGHPSGTYLIDSNGAPIINQTVVHNDSVPAQYLVLDCDDSNSDIYTGATEVGNGLDDDCDGVVDNNTIFFDDGDGYNEVNGDCDDAILL